MGFDCELEKIFTFRYKADVDNMLIENEYDHIYIGYFDGAPVLNEEEVSQSKFVALDELVDWVEREPEAFTVWLRMVLPKFVEHSRLLRKVA